MFLRRIILLFILIEYALNRFAGVGLLYTSYYHNLYTNTRIPNTRITTNRRRRVILYYLQYSPTCAPQSFNPSAVYAFIIHSHTHSFRCTLIIFLRRFHPFLWIYYCTQVLLFLDSRVSSAYTPVVFFLLL